MLLSKSSNIVRNYFVRNLKLSISNKAKVTLVEPYSMVGQNLALLLKQSPVISELRLYSSNDKNNGVYTDLSHIDTPTKVICYNGKDSIFKAIHDTDLTVIVGGKFLNKKCSNPDDLCNVNREFVKELLPIFTSLEKFPFTIFHVEPIGMINRIVRDYINLYMRFEHSKFLTPATHLSSIFNNAASDIIGTKPENMNSQVFYGLDPKSALPVPEINFKMLGFSTSKNKSKCIQKMMDNYNRVHEEHNNTVTEDGPYLSLAHSLYYYINSVCHAIDYDIFVTLPTVIQYAKDYMEFDRRGYYSVMPCIIGKDGINSVHKGYKQYDWYNMKIKERVKENHIQNEVNANKMDPEEIIFRTK